MTNSQKFFGIGSLLAVTLLILSDPSLGLIDNIGIGGELILLLTKLASSILYIAVLFISIEVFLSYINSTYTDLYKRATKSPEGAGMLFIGVGLVALSLSVLILTASL